ncbi:isochorismatase family protein [Niveispirillum sp. BGYR6]|uniref:isochorismatase family protein n=1 Tax=Niveispirillum sp. BGYR6 TaxID=2971249 RepID=UPI0022B97F4A|nr:isochorismatase family protein [Niveispirillum sp. BGYR6]MDG5493730.1 isochorismatase family protein [Niveispirillum sp. BGYR6]
MTKDLNADYAQAGFGNRLGWGKRPALLIIDFVKAYLDPACPLYAGVEKTRDGAEALLRAARAAGIPVIHTNVAYTPGGVDGGVFFRKVKALSCFERDKHPQWAAFADGLEPLPSEPVVTKQYASAFFGTSLAATFTAMGVDTVLIAGLSTSGCVRASALDACQNGFIPLVVREAVGDRDPRIQEANLFDLNAKYADVIALEEAISHLAGSV